MRESKFQRRALQVGDAQARIIEYAYPLESELIPLNECCGRFLAEEVIAPHPFPAFNRSAKDGYAIIAVDTNDCINGNTAWLEIVDNIPCGTVPSVAITSGQAARIMTGAQVPSGADTVVMLEATETKESEGKQYVGIRKRQEAHREITEEGFELSRGELVLPKGNIISAGDIAVLAAFGVHTVTVYCRPKVAIFATGTELLEVHESLEPGKIRNSNSPMLEALVKEAGGDPVMLGAIVDDLELARRKVQMALETYDFVITTGGVSVGDYDIMGDLIREESGEMLFNKVTMRPGSVTTAAVRDGKLLLALSGNPGACFVGFHLFARPVIRLMQSAKDHFLPEWSATLGADYSTVSDFTRFVRARLVIRDGNLVAYPARIDESSVMVTIKDSDCLIIVPPAEKGLLTGTKVTIIKLPGEIRGQ